MKRTLVFSIAALFFSCLGPRAVMTPDEVARWINAYTPEKITATTPIEVEFASALGAGADPDAEVKGVLDFSPSLRGKTYWRDGGTKLIFIPADGALKQGKQYECRVKMPMISDADKEFAFAFFVAGKESRLEIDNVRVTDTQRAAISGTVTLSEPVESLDGKLISCSHTDSLTRIEVGGGGTRWEFTIHGLRRGERDTRIEVSFDAGATGFGDKRTAEATIPGKGVFRVLSARKTDAATPHIDIEFSDALDARQDLDGLIAVERGGGVRIQRTSAAGVRVLYDNAAAPEVTLRVGAEVRSADGQRLGTIVEERFQGEAVPPAVEIPLSGTILPDGNNLKLPFRAVNLAAVDVQVVKIYRNNVLRFLHDNELDEGYRLRRVGRLIFRQTVRLDREPGLDLHRWQNFSIDLAGLFEQEPGAIYRVRISFRHEQSLYGRKSADKFETLAGVGRDEDEDVWLGTSYDWDRYDWDERKDPLKASYYMDYDFPEYNLMASNVGLVVKGAGDDRLWTSATDILTALPMAGVQVTAWDYQLQKVGGGTSDARGFADFAVTRRPFVVTATKGGATSYLKVEPGRANSLSRFDVGGKEIARGLKGFVYGERGVWRPGDVVHLTLVVEDRGRRLPANHPVTMEVRTPQGQFHDRQTLTKGVDGFYTFKIATSDDSPTGTWSASFKVGGETFHKSVRIETIKPNRLKIELGVAGGIIRADGEATFDVSSHWLTGPAAAGLEASLEMTLRNDPQPFEKYKDYIFSNPLTELDSEGRRIASVRLDDKGKATVRHTMVSDKKELPGMLRAEMVCRVTEPGGDQSIVSQAMPYSPYTSYVGVKLGDGKGRPEFETDRDLSFAVVSLDADGRPLRGSWLEYKIYKLEWSWWWEYGARKLNSYVHGTSAEVVAQGKITSGADVSTIPLRIDYPSWGKYLVFVRDTRSGHATGGVVYVDWPSWRGRSNKSDPSAVSMLAFKLDRESYEIGDQATVYIPAAAGGRALVSVENASGVLSREWVATSDKETAHKIAVTQAMTPNCYVHITLLQPHRQTANDLPIRMYGVQPMTVTDKASHLAPVVSVADVVRPQQPFTVVVSEKNGRPMTYTLAIVDEGLLDITNFRTPDLWGAMNRREALGVRTWDLFDNVVGAYSGQWSSILSIGGDEELKVGARKEKRFNPVVEFLGPFTLNRGTKNHTITLPMYVGSVKVMVVAGKEGAYGSADKTVTVRSPLMVLATLPRQLANGERVSLPVNVFAMEPGVRDVEVSVKVEGPLKVSGGASRTVKFSKPSDQLVDFALESDAAKEGMAKVTITAQGGGFTATEVVNIEVRNQNPPVVSTQTRLIDGGGSHDFSWHGGADEVRLEIAAFPAIDFAGTMEFVRVYPHLCTEQLSSRGFYMLYARRFLDEKLAKYAEQTLPVILKELYARQLPGGGFCYWPGEGRAHDWASSMVGQLLVEARAQGYAVSEQVLARWFEYQQKAAKEYRYGADTDLRQAYRLYTLALAKKPETGAMNKLREAGDITMQARWRLAAAYALAGRKEVATELIGGASTLAKTSYATLGSPLRDKAMMLETLVLAGQTARALTSAAVIAREFSTRYCSTNEAAFVSLAMSRLADVVSTKIEGVKFGQTAADSRTVLSPKAVASYVLDPTKGRVRVENLSKGQVAANVMIKRTPGPGEKIAAVAEGVGITVRYTDMDGKAIAIDKLRQGAEFRAIITVTERTGSTGLPSMALTYIAPSGWEIWNERMAGGAQDGADYAYKDIRDDRVGWYFALDAGKSKVFTLRLRAAYEGRFGLPPTVVEDMYNARYRASTANSTVEVER